MGTDGYSEYHVKIENFENDTTMIRIPYDVQHRRDVYPIINNITRTNKSKYGKLDIINEQLKKALATYEPTIVPITDKKQKKLHNTIKTRKKIKIIKKIIKKRMITKSKS